MGNNKVDCLIGAVEIASVLNMEEFADTLPAVRAVDIIAHVCNYAIAVSDLYEKYTRNRVNGITIRGNREASGIGTFVLLGNSNGGSNTICLMPHHSVSL